MKYYFSILFILATAISSRAQFAEKDSLVNVIKNTSEDSVRSDALNEFAFYMFDYNVDSSILLANQAEAIAVRIGNIRQQARALKNLGISYDIKGKTDSALLYLDKALQLAQQNQLHPTLANIITDIANAYYAAGIFELSLRNHFEALKLREEYKAEREIAQTYNNIALVYRSRKDYINAIKYNQLSFGIKRNLKNKQGVINSSINLGSCYQYMGNYDSALYYAKQVMETAFVPQDIHEGKANYASALIGLKRFKEAEKVFTSLLPELDKEEEQAAFISSQKGLGLIASEEGRMEDAINFFTTGAAYARSFNDREFVAAFYKLLAEAYQRKNDYGNAYRYNLLQQSLQDSLLNEENLRQMNEMNAVYEKDKREKQIGKLTDQVSVSKQTAAKNRLQRDLFILASAFLLILAAVVMYGYQNNRKKNKLLSVQKRQIEESLKEKEMLMREIHHRVKNNLQVVTSLLNLQSHYIDDEKAFSAVQAGKNRVQSMALIHQFLYKDVGNLTTLKIKDYVEQLLDYIRDTNEKDGTAVMLRHSIDDVELDIDTVVPIGLIINELVTNAYKYAFEGRAQGIVNLSFTKSAENYSLIVQDDGVGIKENPLLKRTHSFGYRMIKAFAEKLEGKLTIENRGGTLVSLIFPHRNEK